MDNNIKVCCHTNKKICLRFKFFLFVYICVYMFKEGMFVIVR